MQWDAARCHSFMVKSWMPALRSAGASLKACMDASVTLGTSECTPYHMDYVAVRDMVAPGGQLAAVCPKDSATLWAKVRPRDVAP